MRKGWICAAAAFVLGTAVFTGMAQGGKITREIDHDFILNQFQYKEGQEKKTSVLRRKIRLRKGKGGKKK